ncbi:acyl-CoA synthetase [Rhodoferax sp. PAMC 29310]|uniref:acyl-CoA synthetase n=1 Tax=Rhodoferax sp. PAMC 29310 TaxID=2822760 RepID=UPI001B32DFF9|nr:acyl-CoA synthetase [Rhodoferax sp. PAMC 29310]
MNKPSTPPTAANQPFVAPPPIRSLDDVRRLEALPLAQTVAVPSTYALLCNSARAFGSKPALTFLRTANPEDAPIRWSYADLLAGVHQTANLLHSLGVGPEDAVAVLLPGCLEYHLALWGGEAAGIVQPLNPLLSDEKLVSLMTVARAKVLIAYGSDADTPLWSKALRLRTQVATLTTVLRVAPHDETLDSEPPLPEGVLDFGSARAAQVDDHLVSGRNILPTDVAAYFHTGGTTGAPKLARHSHGSQVFTAWACVMMQGVQPTDVGINGYPLFHVAGVLPGSLTALAAGAETVIPTTALMRNRDVLANYWHLVEKYRATSVSGVPTVLAALSNVPRGAADISSVRYCRTGAAPMPAELGLRFERQFGIHVHESFGMTEMAGISTVTPPGVVGPAGCVGFAPPYVRMRVVALDASGGATNTDMPAGEQGMVLFQSPNVFPGFLDPVDTAHAFTPEGWLATGDLGWLDSEGRLNLSGRAKDLIIRGGHNIDPKTIEDALSAHPAVQLCAAVGAPDAYAGELPVMFATLVPGARATEAELLDFVATRVDEAPARPKAVTILATMPMTNVGKIFKPDLRQLATQAVVVALVEQVYRDQSITGEPAVIVEIDPQHGVRVSIPTDLAGERFAVMHAAVKDALARLPVKVALHVP